MNTQINMDGWDNLDEGSLGAMFGGQGVQVKSKDSATTQKCTCGHYEAGHDAVGCEICDPKATNATPKEALKCREFTALNSILVNLHYCKKCACANVLHKDLTKECQSIADCGCKEYTPGGTSDWSVRTCDHWRNKPLKVGKGIIHASAFSDRPLKDDDWLKSVDPPDIGIYLYEGWVKAFGGASYGVAPIHKPPYPFLYIPWTDMRSIPLPFMQRLTTRICSYLEKGKKVEIACMGGHGRTGTLVAAVVGQVTGWDAKKAIEWVHENHCKNAVESDSQIDSVYETLGEEKPTHAIPLKGYVTQWTGGKGVMPPSTWHPEWAKDRCTCVHLREEHWTIKIREAYPASDKAKARILEDASCFRCSCNDWDLGKLAGSF